MMSDIINRPKQFRKLDEDEKEEIADLLCSYGICSADTNDCTKCAFYSNENFDKFIKQCGL